MKHMQITFHDTRDVNKIFYGKFLSTGRKKKKIRIFLNSSVTDVNKKISRVKNNLKKGGGNICKSLFLQKVDIQLYQEIVKSLAN